MIDINTLKLTISILLCLLIPQIISGVNQEHHFEDFALPAEQTTIPHKITLDFLKTKGYIGGWIQLDKNGFLDSPVPHKQHLIRRLRLYCTTTSRDLLTLMFMVDGDKDTWNYHYIYAEMIKPEFFKVRFGLCKKPFGLEALYSSRYFWMINRSLGTINYLTLLDIGLIPYGTLFSNTILYGLGVFNGNGTNLKNNPDKVYCGRLVWRPWHHWGDDNPLKGLQFGSSYSTSQKIQKLSGTSFQTGSETSFLTWKGSHIKSKTGKSIVGGDIEWLYGPTALRGEFLIVDWGKVTNHSKSTHFSGYSWYVEGGYFLTGERQVHNLPLFPSENFNFCRGGGALELQGRYEAFQADHKVIEKGFATGTTFVSSVTVAINYYFNPFILTRFDWQLSNFHDRITVKNKTTRNESVLTWRLQGEF